MTNLIPDSLDQALKLYTPLLDRLMWEFPEIGGAELFVGREDPGILVWDGQRRVDVACEYEHAGVTASSRAELLDLVDATIALNDQLKAFTSHHEPLSIDASKGNETTQVTASISLMGGLRASRDALMCHPRKDENPDGMATFFATVLSLTCLTENLDCAHRDRLIEKSAEGMESLIDYAVRERLALNIGAKDAEAALRWYPACPTGDAPAKTRDLEVILKFSAMAQDDPTQKIVVGPGWVDRLPLLREAGIDVEMVESWAPPGQGQNAAPHSEDTTPA